jgi:hypothetical protein
MVLPIRPWTEPKSGGDRMVAALYADAVLLLVVNVLVSGAPADGPSAPSRISQTLSARTALTRAKNAKSAT